MKLLAFWTPDRVDTLTELVPTDLTYSTIAALLGCTKDAAIGKAYRMRLPMKTKPREAVPTTTLERLDAVDIFPKKQSECCFPLGDLRKGGLTFCGERVREPGEPYCEEHRGRCWTKDNRDGPRTKFSFDPLSKAAAE